MQIQTPKYDSTNAGYNILHTESLSHTSMARSIVDSIQLPLAMDSLVLQVGKGAFQSSLWPYALINYNEVILDTLERFGCYHDLSRGKISKSFRTTGIVSNLR